MQIWDLQRSAAGGPLCGGAGSGRANGRAPRPSARASGKAGEPPRAVITGMEGLELRFRGAEVYPAYQPGMVQAMHSGEALRMCMLECRAQCSACGARCAAGAQQESGGRIGRFLGS